MTLNVSISSVEWCFFTRYGRKVAFFSIVCRKICFQKVPYFLTIFGILSLYVVMIGMKLSSKADDSAHCPPLL